MRTGLSSSNRRHRRTPRVLFPTDEAIGVGDRPFYFDGEVQLLRIRSFPAPGTPVGIRRGNDDRKPSEVAVQNSQVFPVQHANGHRLAIEGFRPVAVFDDIVVLNTGTSPKPPGSLPTPRLRGQGRPPYTFSHTGTENHPSGTARPCACATRYGAQKGRRIRHSRPAHPRPGVADRRRPICLLREPAGVGKGEGPIRGDGLLEKVQETRCVGIAQFRPPPSQPQV